MTPGPASSMVTLLPRNNPTPIAPPIAIIVSWRGLSLRRKPSLSEKEPSAVCGDSAIARSSMGAARPPRLFSEHSACCLTATNSLHYADKFLDLVDGVVMNQRSPHRAVSSGNLKAL